MRAGERRPPADLRTFQARGARTESRRMLSSTQVQPGPGHTLQASVTDSAIVCQNAWDSNGAEWQLLTTCPYLTLLVSELACAPR